MEFDDINTAPPVDPSKTQSTRNVPSAAGTEPIALGSVCTGYGGLDIGVAAAFGGVRLAWCADPDPHVSTILAARFSEVVNLGDIRTIDWHAVEPVDVVTAGFPCLRHLQRRQTCRDRERRTQWSLETHRSCPSGTTP